MKWWKKWFQPVGPTIDISEFVQLGMDEIRGRVEDILIEVEHQSIPLMECFETTDAHELIWSTAYHTALRQACERIRKGVGLSE